jgi:hypothetical protein
MFDLLSGCSLALDLQEYAVMALLRRLALPVVPLLPWPVCPGRSQGE